MTPLLAFALLSATQPAPAWIAGDWDPYSNAFTGLRILTVGRDSLTWHGCQNAHFDVVDTKDHALTIRLAKNSTCKLDDEPPTRIDTVRFTLRDNQCDLAVSIYASADALAKNEPAAEGLYGKSKCPSGPAAQAATNLSTTPR